MKCDVCGENRIFQLEKDALCACNQTKEKPFGVKSDEELRVHWRRAQFPMVRTLWMNMTEDGCPVPDLISPNDLLDLLEFSGLSLCYRKGFVPNADRPE